MLMTPAHNGPIREGEAPAEPRNREILIQRGLAGASPSRHNDRPNFFTANMAPWGHNEG
jgi:hypothetical protein